MTKTYWNYATKDTVAAAKIVFKPLGKKNANYSLSQNSLDKTHIEVIAYSFYKAVIENCHYTKNEYRYMGGGVTRLIAARWKVSNRDARKMIILT